MIVEVWIDGALMLELLEADEDYVVLIYPAAAGGPWELTRGLLAEAMDAASARMDTLLGR